MDPLHDQARVVFADEIGATCVSPVRAIHAGPRVGAACDFLNHPPWKVFGLT